MKGYIKTRYLFSFELILILGCSVTGVCDAFVAPERYCIKRNENLVCMGNYGTSFWWQRWQRLNLSLDPDGIDQDRAGLEQVDKKSRVKYSSARAGGRVNRSRGNKSDESVTSHGPMNDSRLIKSVIPLVSLLLFVKLLGSMLFSGDNYVYYESTVYQTTTRTEDGKIETTRKQNFKSNIPGLREKSNIQDIDNSIRLEQDQIEREMNNFMKDFLIRSYDIDF